MARSGQALYRYLSCPESRLCAFRDHARHGAFGVANNVGAMACWRVAGRAEYGGPQSLHLMTFSQMVQRKYRGWLSQHSCCNLTPLRCRPLPEMPSRVSLQMLTSIQNFERRHSHPVDVLDGGKMDEREDALDGATLHPKVVWTVLAMWLRARPSPAGRYPERGKEFNITRELSSIRRCASRSYRCIYLSVAQWHPRFGTRSLSRSSARDLPSQPA